MARRLTMYHKRREHELADPESKVSLMQDPDRAPYAKRRESMDPRLDREAAEAPAPVVAVKAKKAKAKKAA